MFFFQSGCLSDKSTSIEIYCGIGDLHCSDVLRLMKDEMDLWTAQSASSPPDFAGLKEFYAAFIRKSHQELGVTSILTINVLVGTSH